MSTRVPIRRLAVAGLAAAAGLSLLLAVPSLRPVVDQLHDASSGWLAAAAALELASCLSFVVIFRLCFDRIAARDARRVAWASMATGVLLPGGGVTGLAVGGWLMRRCGAPAGWIARRSSALFFVTSAANVAAVAAAGLVLLVSPAGPHDFARAWLPTIVACAAAGLVIAVPALAARGRAVERRWAGELIEGIRDAVRTLARPHWRLLGAVGYLAFDVAVLWTCFRALGDVPSPAALMLGYLLGYLANVVPVPGGVGVLDGGLVAALVLYGLPATHAVAAVLLYHALAFWLPSLGGLAAYARLRRGGTAPAMVEPWPPSLSWATPV
jgi:uncharacterized membrane protein YbhN (UPF0104 family)